MYLYHIRRHKDEGNLQEGYIGVSNNPAKRWMQHRNKPNKKLKEALNTFTDIEMVIVTEGTDEEMLALEFYLRPEYGMGWNIAVGGGKPPSGNRKGSMSSEESKAKRAKTVQEKFYGRGLNLNGKPLKVKETFTPEQISERISDGMNRETVSNAQKHRFENPDEIFKAQQRYKDNLMTCPCCGKVMSPALYKRWGHGEDCNK